MNEINFRLCGNEGNVILDWKKDAGFWRLSKKGRNRYGKSNCDH